MNAGNKLRAEKIISVFWMYLLFKAGNVILGHLFHQNVKLSLFEDASAPWYLLALVIWYLSVPFLERIKAGYLIIGSFLIGLFAGYIGSIGLTFSLSRVFVFFPFFIAGFLLSEDKLEKLLDKHLRLPAVLFMLIIVGGMVLLWDRIKPFIDIIYGTSAYAKTFKAMAAYGAVIRGVWYVLAILLSVSLMLIVPRCKLFFSIYGGRTLQVYMTHIWIRNILAYTGLFAVVKAGPAYGGYLLLLGSAALAFLLSNRWNKKLFDLLMAKKLLDKIIKN
jgi:fucose 4-O-acetylase-like acetyltransferase